jgi:hypothetical protein
MRAMLKQRRVRRRGMKRVRAVRWRCRKLNNVRV